MLNCASYFVIGIAAGVASKHAKPVVRAVLKQGIRLANGVQKKAVQVKEGFQDVVAEASTEATE